MSTSEKWTKSAEPGYSYTVFGEAEDATRDQLRNCLVQEEGSIGVLCADNHLGYSMPIGGVVAWRGLISPNAVGFDIGCGNKAVLTNLKREDIVDDLPRLMDEIFTKVSFGMGRRDGDSADHEVLDEVRDADFEPQRDLYDLAAKQLGTVGAGNHYVDLFCDEEERVWVGVHFGSRGLGHKTCSGFLALSAGKGFHDHGIEGEMMSPPVVFDVQSALGESYVCAMELAGKYAYAGRDVVCDKVLSILGAQQLESVHNHHNFAWRETHFGEEVWVVRKGATPAFPGQRGFVGATMGEPSVIIEGQEGIQSEDALYSTIHGAGRQLSRTKAAGKMGQRAECNDRNCSFWVPWKQYLHEAKEAGIRIDKKSNRPAESFTTCPAHPEGNMLKRRGRIKDGLIDYDVVRQEVAAAGIELRGGAADEAPAAYKRLDEVLVAHGGTIKVVHTLYPMGVAMAGADTFDAFKD